MAEDYLAEEEGLAGLRLPDASPLEPVERDDIATAAARGFRASRLAPLVLTKSTRESRSASRAIPRWPSLSQKGPATPDHLIFTKPAPMLGSDVAGTRTLPELLRAQLNDGQGDPRPCSTRRRAAARSAARLRSPPAAARARPRSSRNLRPQYRRHPARRGARRLARAWAKATCSTSSTGTSSRPSAQGPRRRRCSAAKSCWSPVPHRGSARPVRRIPAGAAPRGRPGPESRVRGPMAAHRISSGGGDLTDPPTLSRKVPQQAVGNTVASTCSF